MRHLDLFSGIGGFALATEWAFPEETVEHIFCDNEPFSQAILKKHWPNSLIYGDIRELTAERIAADTRGKRRQQVGGGAPSYESADEGRTTQDDNQSPGIGEGAWRPDLLTGGFPCQPFSSAGRRKGTEDDRHLWPEMLRVIRETNPTFVLGENVGGLVTWDGGMVLEMVLSDLEEAGYEAGAFIIPACAVNAPHRRDRVWIAAHTKRCDARRTPRQLRGQEGEERLSERDEVGKPGEPGSVRDAADSIRERLERGCMQPELQEPTQDTGRIEWDEDWPQVAARLCTLDDGLPNGLARPRGWRNAALKGAGNAIVPQVAAEVLRAMRQTV